MAKDDLSSRQQRAHSVVSKPESPMRQAFCGFRQSRSRMAVFTPQMRLAILELQQKQDRSDNTLGEARKI
jgi:hypothetical protein